MTGCLMTRHARPPATGLNILDWMRLPVLRVPVDAVLPTQEVGELHAGPANGFGDPVSHVVVVDGRWLIEDGHHRWAKAKATGETYWQARVFVAPVLPE